MNTCPPRRPCQHCSQGLPCPDEETTLAAPKHQPAPFKPKGVPGLMAALAVGAFALWLAYRAGGR